MEDKTGVYAKAFRKLSQAGKFNGQTLQKWKDALRWVSLLKGFIVDGEEGETMEKITGCVAEYIEMAKCEGKESEEVS
ncbi:hypothetical protein SUGI_0080550 [Cryptomeria japonica]|nr:hypothetical protein SUGI_0080550 [Cryptomeria japonica]